MQRLRKDIVYFLKKQHFVIVSSIDEKGFPHTSCKGIVKVEDNKIYILDLYRKNTYANISKKRLVSVTAVDEEKFMGYCIKGEARIVDLASQRDKLLKKWDDRLLERVSRRVLNHIRKDKSSLYHPEINMPRPKYVIEIEPKKVISLIPPHE